MRVTGLIWVGTRTDNFEKMVSFAEGALGLTASGSDGVAGFDLPDGSLFEVFSPEHHGGGHPSRGVVPGFEVEDVVGAHAELAAVGVGVSEVRGCGTWKWAYFRAPDGCLYEIAQRDA